MKRYLLLLLILFPLVTKAGVFDFLLSGPSISLGDGNIGTLDKWTSTSSPSDSITQRTFGKPIKISGLSDGCLGLTNGLVTSTGSTCGAGSGGYPFTPASNFNTNNQATTGIAWFQNGLNASSTSNFDYASTTAISANTLCISTDCRTAWSTGVPYPFTPTTNFNVNNQATTGIPWFRNGFNASSTSRVGSTTFDTSGKIGVGLTSPTALLSINPTASLVGNTPIVSIASSSKTVLTIANSGNVGINTATPGQILTVVGNSGVDSQNVVTFLGRSDLPNAIQFFPRQTGGGVGQAKINFVGFGANPNVLFTGGAQYNFDAPITTLNASGQAIMYNGTAFDPAPGILATVKISAVAGPGFSYAPFTAGVNGTSPVDVHSYAGYFNNSSSVSGTGIRYGIYVLGGSNYFSGRIGIGTTTPGTPLSVVGDGYFTGRATSREFVSTATTSSSIFPYASSTALSATTICISTDCRTAFPSAGGGTYPFTPANNFNTNNQATTGILWIQNGINASSTSHFDNASTTLLTATTAYITNLANLTTGFVKVTGGVLSVDNTSYQPAGTYVNSVGATFPVTSTGGVTPSIGYNGLGTSSNLTTSNLTYVTGANTIAGVATTSVSCGGIISCTDFTVIGSSPVTITASAGTSASSTLLSDVNAWSGQEVFSYATTSQLTLAGQVYDGNNSNGTAGYTLMSRGGNNSPIWSATTTFNSPLNYSNGAVTLSTAGTWSGNAGTATSLASNGSNCSAGSYPLGVDASGNSENCTVATTGTVTSVIGTFPIFSSGGNTPVISYEGLSTSSPISAGANVLYATGVNTVASVATGTVSGTNGITVTANRYALNGSLAIDCTVASISTTGCLTNTDYITFNNKQPAGNYLTVSPFSASTNYAVTNQATSGILWLQNGLNASSTSHIASTTFDISGSVGIGTTTPGNGSIFGVHGKSIYDDVANFLGGIYIKIASAFTPSAEGEIGIDTTDNQLKFQSGSATRVISPDITGGFTYATSTAWTGTTTLQLGPGFYAETWNKVKCYTDVGTLNVQFYNNTTATKMNMFNASTTIGTVGFTTNNAISAGSKRLVDIGTPATSPTTISCTVSKTRDAS